MKQKRGFGSFLIWLVIVAILFFAYSYRDEFKARDFILTGDLSEIVFSIKLTGRADTILRATHPELQQKDAFNESCHSHSQEVYVLGCYREDQDRLYVYNVNSKDLPGVREVTTAHEMLHAAYHRLYFWEKANLDKELKQVYDQLPQDSELRTSMQSYPASEFSDELHSRLGTEIADLPASLENYYKRYFTDRQRIVEYNTKYHAVFTKLKDETERLKKSIESKKQAIETRTKNYQNSQQALSLDVNQFNNNANNGNFISQTEFYQQRQSLIDRIRNQNTEYNELQKDVESLNADIAKYNQTVYHSNQLINQINSNSIPKAESGLTKINK